MSLVGNISWRIFRQETSRSTTLYMCRIVIGIATYPLPEYLLYFMFRQATVEPVAPVAYQVILEPGIDQFCELEPRRVHTHINSLELFVVHKLTCGKRESVS